MTEAARPGLFVVFEGIDGSGKTTLSNRVAKKLAASGLSVTQVRENGLFASAVTQSIRELGRDQRNLAMTPSAELLLFLAREIQLLEEATQPALLTADVVIADRFLYSAEVLAQHGRGLPAETVREIVAAAGRGFQPDLVILVDVDPQLARARRRVAKVLHPDSKPASRKGLAGQGMQHRLREGYRQLAAGDPARWVVLDNTEALLEEVEAAIVQGLLAAQTGGVATGRDLMRARLAIKAVGSGPIAIAATVEQAGERFFEWVDRRATSEPDLAAYHLGGLAGLGIDERRIAMAPRSPAVIANGMRGLSDAVSWRLRLSLADQAPEQVAWSLLGATGSDDEAMFVRRELAARAPAQVALSLSTVNTPDAWTLRAQLQSVAPLAVLASLNRLDSELAWALREQALGRFEDAVPSSFELADAICQSITGLDDDRAWTLRKHAYAMAPASAIESLGGLTCPRAQDWRTRHLARAPKAVMSSLYGIDDDHAWHLRDQVAATCKEAIDSIENLDGAQAWHLRERCRDIWPWAVAASMGPTLAHTTRGADLFGDLLSRHSGIALWRAAAGVVAAKTP